jgi:hypothetical protein
MLESALPLKALRSPRAWLEMVGTCSGSEVLTLMLLEILLTAFGTEGSSTRWYHNAQCVEYKAHWRPNWVARVLDGMV